MLSQQNEAAGYGTLVLSQQNEAAGYDATVLSQLNEAAGNMTANLFMDIFGLECNYKQK